MNADELEMKLAATRRKRMHTPKAIFFSNLLFSCLPLTAEMLMYPTRNTRINREKTLIGNFNTTRRRKTSAGYEKERIFIKAFSFLVIRNLFGQRLQYIYNVLYGSYAFEHIGIH